MLDVECCYRIDTNYRLSFRGFVKFELFIRSYFPAACTNETVTSYHTVSMFMYETIQKHLISNTNGNINDNKRSYSQDILIV